MKSAPFVLIRHFYPTTRIFALGNGKYTTFISRETWIQVDLEPGWSYKELALAKPWTRRPEKNQTTSARNWRMAYSAAIRA